MTTSNENKLQCNYIIVGQRCTEKSTLKVRDAPEGYCEEHFMQYIKTQSSRHYEIIVNGEAKTYAEAEAKYNEMICIMRRLLKELPSVEEGVMLSR